jgi:hypothetical protein
MSLLLYDSCHSAHPAVNISGQGVTELIAACGFETHAPAVGPHSFTNALIRELEESFAGPPIPVTELHSKVISSLKNWKPSLLRDENGNVWTDENGRAKYECHKRRTPVYCFLTNESPYRSIMLARLPSKLSLTSVANMDKVIDPDKQTAGCEAEADAGELSVLAEEPKGTAEAQSSVSDEMLHSAHPSQINSSAQSTQPTTVSESPRPEDSLRVLLAVRLEEDFFLENEDEDDGKRIRTWCNWLKAIPYGVQNVTIEGIYKSCSALILLTLPIALWDLLPNNAAYSFIGFVKPNNWSKADLARLQPTVGDSKLDKVTSAPYFPPNPEPKERLKQHKVIKARSIKIHPVR